MEINSDLLAPCSLYCGVCGVFFATRDNNDAFLEKLVGVYKGTVPGMDDLKIDDLKCDGCLSDNRVSIFCRVCSIKSCAKEKKIDGCHQCDDFPCVHIDEFPVPVGKKVILRAVPYWKKWGTEKWVSDEEVRYLCPECNHPLFRGAKRCNTCKTPVDLD